MRAKLICMNLIDTPTPAGYSTNDTERLSEQFIEQALPINYEENIPRKSKLCVIV